MGSQRVAHDSAAKQRTAGNQLTGYEFLFFFFKTFENAFIHSINIHNRLGIEEFGKNVKNKGQYKKAHCCSAVSNSL